MTTKSFQALSRQLTGLALTACCTLMLSASAFAQEQTQPAQTQQPEARPIPQRTVGLAPGKVARWTLRDAILAALENNPDIEIERTNVRQAGFDLLAAEGAYDPISTQGFSYNSSGSPNTRPFSGVGSDQSALTR